MKFLNKIPTKLKIISLIIVSPFVWILIFSKITMRYSDRIYSPDRANFTQISESNGGATTGFVTDVTLVNARSPFNFSTIFSSRTGDSKSVFATNGPLNSINVAWTNNKSIAVSYSNCTKEYGLKSTNWRNIEISYQGKCDN